MSIIERAADLLRSAPRAQQRQPAPGEHAGPAPAVERASMELQERATKPADKPAPAKGRVQSATPATRSFRIDRDRLRAQSMITPEDGRTPIAEHFRRVKREILATIANPRPGAPPANLVSVTSTFPGEGKTFCAINLAISLALEVDRTVLLVDGDVARARVPPALGLHADKGLLDVLLDRQVALADVLWQTDIGRLSLLTAGTTNKHATELLASNAMRGLLRDIAERDRIVIFDAPPLLAASEASAVASQMGQIVVVVEAGTTSEAALKEALSRIDTSRVTGLLLNKVQSPYLEYGYDAYG